MFNRPKHGKIRDLEEFKVRERETFKALPVQIHRNRKGTPGIHGKRKDIYLGRKMWGVTTNEHGVSLGANENVLELNSSDSNTIL